MGCNPSRVGIPTNEQVVQQNHKLVREIWTYVCNEYYDEIGIAFMVRLFQTQPHLRKKWIFAANLELEDEIRANSQARYHAAKIMYTLNEIIHNIEDGAKRRGILESLGKIHCTYEVEPADFQVAEATIIYVLSTTLRKKFTMRHKQAWSYFFQQVIVDLGRGVEQQGTNSDRLKKNQI